MDFLTSPFDWWIEPFYDNVFMRNALWSGLLAVLATSTVGTWVVLRGMSFFGEALGHGVLPGIAIAFILGGDTMVGAVIAALVMVFGVNLIRAHSPLPEDSSIGLLYVGFLALAVVILSSSSGAYSGDITRFLFGSITGVTDSDLLRQLIIAGITLLGIVVLHRAFLVMTFDEVQAELLGLRPRVAHAALLALLAIAIVASFQAVGNLLVFAFLVAPPSTAAMCVRRVPAIMITAVMLGALAVVVGLLISYHHDTAAGATMALGTVILFLIALLIRSLSGTYNVRLIT
ncbi:MAG: metal ABC transporter permease [bacterium]|nr:metal ABC transporter permease [bacterium]MXZ77633.1 metal ABC transporter permease [Acidimicrobiia bacterium]MYE74364.1 metal ABC transporter permease [Acidimicrobiia bacterium]MYJ62100.1 metal ABC transporter permease [Acidimicrobiia bacterium]